MFSKPDFGVGIEQAFIIVVRHPSTILDFTNHVPHSIPRHALYRPLFIAIINILLNIQNVVYAITIDKFYYLSIIFLIQNMSHDIKIGLKKFMTFLLTNRIHT